MDRTFTLMTDDATVAAASAYGTIDAIENGVADVTVRIMSLRVVFRAWTDALTPTDKNWHVQEFADDPDPAEVWQPQVGDKVIVRLA